MAKQHLQLQKAHAALHFLVSGDLILVEKLTCRIPVICTEHAEWIYGKRTQEKLRCMVEINAVIAIEDGIYNSCETSAVQLPQPTFWLGIVKGLR